jgi:hypothetical protein
MKKHFFILIAIFFTVGLFAQDQRTPASIFNKIETEDFKSKKFDWKDASTVKGGTIVRNGYCLLKGKRPTFSPNPVNVVSTALLPFDPKNNFKITVKLNVIELTGYSVFQISLNSGNVVFGIAEGDWAASANGVIIQGPKKTSKNDNVSLSIQKEDTKLYFFYNDTLLGSLDSQEIESSDIMLLIRNIVQSAEVRVTGVIVEY